MTTFNSAHIFNYDIVKLGVTEKMEYNQRVEFKCRTSEPIVGAFAMGATQNFPRLCFASNVRYIRRIQIRIKIILKYLSYM